MLHVLGLVVYLVSTFVSGPSFIHSHRTVVPIFAKAGAGTDPNGSPLAAPAPHTDAGAGADPDGSR
ncbi:MAG TPA: hypothetical protein VLX28_21685 [Thermoanaerobaculia bacterium]|nr:hypothetical protein [Thermoanaerobaculia bacterium]